MKLRFVEVRPGRLLLAGVLAVGLMGSIWAWEKRGFVHSLTEPDFAHIEHLMMLAGEGRNPLALDELRGHAQDGRAEIQRALGIALLARTDPEGLRWLEQAAQRGDRDAAFLLGNAYLQGIRLQRDYAASWRWFKQAAEAGHASAAYYLGIMSRSGYGVAPDALAAVAWFQEAARLKSASGLFMLANAYRNGEGVPVDVKQALALYHEAAEMEHPESMQVLAMAYSHGEMGLQRDQSRANFYLFEGAHALTHRATLN